MVDNLRGGDPGRPPQALSPSRPQPGPQEGPYLSLGKVITVEHDRKSFCGIFKCFKKLFCKLVKSRSNGQCYWFLYTFIVLT